MLGIKRYWAPMLAAVSISCSSFAETVAATEGVADHSSAVATKKSDTNTEQFENWKSSSFAIFYHDKTLDFSQYDEIIFFPTTYKNLIFSAKSNRQLEESWKKDLLDEMKEASQNLDTFLAKKFKASKYFKLTDKEGSNVLQMEFRMKEFFPSSKNDSAATGTRGLKRDLLGLGALTYQAVIVDSKTKKLVAVIEDRILIDSSVMTSNINVNRSIAWSKSMQYIAEKLHKDLGKRKKLSKK